MSGKHATVYILLAAVVIWWLFFRKYSITVPVDEVTVRRKETIPVSTPQVGDTGGSAESFDPAYVDSLPQNTEPETYDVGYVTALGETMDPLQPPRFVEGS